MVRKKNSQIRTFCPRLSLNNMEGGLRVSMPLQEQYDKIYKYCYFKVKNEMRRLHVQAEADWLVSGNLILSAWLYSARTEP